MKKVVCVMFGFVLALLATIVSAAPAQNAGATQQDEVVWMANRLDAVEAGQQKADREAAVLRKKVKELGGKQEKVSLRTTDLEQATVSIGGRVKSLEGYSAAIDRRSANSEDRINNLVLDSRRVDNSIKVLERRSMWALGLAILSLLPWVGLAAVVGFAWVASRREDAGGPVEAPTMCHDTRLRDIRHESVVDAEIVAHRGDGESQANPNDTLDIPPLSGSPTREQLKVVDAAMDRARQPIPTQPAV